MMSRGHASGHDCLNAYIRGGEPYYLLYMVQGDGEISHLALGVFDLTGQYRKAQRSHPRASQLFADVPLAIVADRPASMTTVSLV